MDQLLRDIRHAARALAAIPTFAVIAVVVLSLGIGMTAAMFSIVRGVILRGLPFENAPRIMALAVNNPLEGPTRLGVLLHDYYDWGERQTSFERLAAYRLAQVTLSGGAGVAETFFGATVTANTFGLLAVVPMLGRDFEPDDGLPGAARVALIGAAMWRDRFESDPAIVGQMIRVNSEPTTIIGVMPERFEFPVNQDVWLPSRQSVLELERSDGGSWRVFGLLKEEVPLRQARAEFSSIAAQLAAEHPETNTGIGVIINPFVTEVIGYQAPGFFYTMLGAVSLVLVVACANVANLLLVRAAVRGREVAIRNALGASRRRIIRLLLVESTLLASVGAILGIGVALLGVKLFNQAINAAPFGMPFWFDIRIDPGVLVFVVLLAMAASILSGLLPAVRASGADLNNVLKDESRAASGLRIGRVSRSLVMAEIALSCTLLIGAGLMIKSVMNANHLDFGLATDDVFVGQVTIPEADYPDPASRVRLFNRILDGLRGKPGVRIAALSNGLPVLGSGNVTIAIEGEVYTAARDYPRTRFGAFTPGYLDALGTGVLRGRSFTQQDDADAAPVAIVNETFVQRFYTGDNPIGRRLRIRENQILGPLVTIVGVLPDWYLDREAAPFTPDAIFVPMAQRGAASANVVIRATGDPLGLASIVREELAAIDRDLPLSIPSTLGAQIRESNRFPQIFGTVFAVFGVVALIMAAVGIYGVMAFTVRQRTHEVGLRIALGSSPRAVLRLMLRQGLVQLVVGLVVGLLLASAVGRLLSIALFDVHPVDPPVFVAVAGVLLVVGLVASFIPARWATKVDPMVAMRE